MEWLRQLSNAIEYIENNLDKEISYDQAAKIACCSTYYFQRMFSYVAGISLSEYIRRRRMTQAAFELQRTNKKVLEIALTYGYTSPTSFNRAFQSIHGITPTTARNIGSTLNAYPPIKFTVKITGESAMSYRIEKKVAMRIVGMRIPLVENMEENQKSVPNFWNEIIKTNKLRDLYQISNTHPQGILGVTVYQNPQNIFYYIAVATSKPVPVGQFEYEIPECTWVVFENEGRFKESVQTCFHRFMMEWLPFSGYEYAGLPDIEVYPFLKEKKIKGHSEVWIAIRKIKENL